MKKFKYLIPKTLDEAVSLHQSHGGSAMYVAGGTDVMVKIKSGKLAPDYLISLKHIGDGISTRGESGNRCVAHRRFGHSPHPGDVFADQTPIPHHT